MAKMAKAKTPAQTAQTAQSEILTEEMYSFAELNPALEKVFAEMGVEGEGQANIYISKIMQDGREAKIWQGPPSDYDLLSIARKYGSGDYRVKIYVQHDSGRFVMKGNQIYPVMLEAGEDARLEAMRKGEGMTQQAGTPGFTLDALTAAIKAAIPAPVASASNLGMLKEVAEIVRTLAPQSQVQPAFNPLEILKIAAEFARDNRSSDDPIDRGINATGMDVFMRLVDKFAPMFAETLMKNQATAAALPQPQQPKPEPAPSGGNGGKPAASQDTQSIAEESIMRLKMGLAFLVAQAEADNDPATYAAVVLDNVPEESITEFLKNPAPLEYLAQYEPKVKAHAKWFQELIESVKMEISAPDAGNDAGGGIDGQGKSA